MDERPLAVAPLDAVDRRSPARAASGRPTRRRAAPRSRRRSRSAGSRASRSTRSGRRARPSAGRRSGRSPRSASSLLALELGAQLREALSGGAGESLRVDVVGVVVEGRGVRVAQLLEAVGDRLEHELVVAVRLLGLVALGGVVRASRPPRPRAAARARPRRRGRAGGGPGRRSGRGGSSQQLAVEVEVRCRRGVPGQLVARAQRAGARLLERGRGRARSSRIAPASPSTSSGETTRPAPNARTGSARPPTSYTTAGTPAPSARRSAPLWSSSAR